MKWPTMDEFAKNVAEKALDEYEYNGKTLRQWIEIILATASEDKINRRAAVDAMDLYCENTCPIRADRWCPDCQIEELKKIVLGSATDINVATKVGTNLAEVGTDCISRQSAIDAIDEYMVGKNCASDGTMMARLINELVIKRLPPAEPQIIRCKDCKHWIPYDWMFSEIWQSKNIADYPEDDIGCDCCDMAMKANDFCSRAERRTE